MTWRKVAMRRGNNRVGIVGRGVGGWTLKFMSTDAHFWVKIGYFNPWAKFQTFRQLTSSSFRSIPTLGKQLTKRMRRCIVPGMLWSIRAMSGTFMRRFIATSSVLRTATSLNMSTWCRIDGLLARHWRSAARCTRSRDSSRSYVSDESTRRTALVSSHVQFIIITFLYCAT